MAEYQPGYHHPRRHLVTQRTLATDPWVLGIRQLFRYRDSIPRGRQGEGYHVSSFLMEVVFLRSAFASLLSLHVLFVVLDFQSCITPSYRTFPGVGYSSSTQAILSDLVIMWKTLESENDRGMNLARASTRPTSNAHIL